MSGNGSSQTDQGILNGYYEGNKCEMTASMPIVKKFPKSILVARDVKARSDPGKADNLQTSVDFVHVQTESQGI
ncbi:hypothetical protein T07_13850 [Trichinella nelsoni]|uniref:Uncharacterized protein n=1 Tax=Trichinella nelsoni TaxID=6336 RepID=A0A0V0SCQ2_9BILA|nr:hypothetical protein T07_13850 [Trichinella nelsoni]